MADDSHTYPFIARDVPRHTRRRYPSGILT